MNYGTKITGVGTYKHSIVSNDDYIKVFGKKAKFISDKLPHKTRYSVIDINTGEVDITNSEMGYRASSEAIKNAGLVPSDIDMIIYCSSTPDFLLPPTFTLLQEKLEIEKCMGMDIRSGCSGFGSAITTAQQYITNGFAKRILLVGSEVTSSRLTFLFKRGIKDFPLKALYNLMLFGDAAGALVLEQCPVEENEIYGNIMGSSRPYKPIGSLMEVGGSVTPFPDFESDMKLEDIPIVQNTAETEVTIPEVMIEAIDEFLTKNSLTIDYFDYYILPIDSQRVGHKVFEHFNLDIDKIISVGSEGGSLVNAAVPLAFEKGVRQSKIKKGSKVLIYAAENTRWQYSVMGYTVK